MKIYKDDLTGWNKLFKYGKTVARKMGVKNEDDVNRIISEYRKEKTDLVYNSSNDKRAN